MEEQKQKYNLGWPYVTLYRFTQQSLARLQQCHKISHYNFGQACYSQAQLTCYLSATIAADGEDQHMARESRSVTIMTFCLTRIKRVKRTD